MIISLYDFDQSRGHQTENYLYRSSQILRKTAQPSLASKHALIDRHLRLALTSEGPQFWNLEMVEQTCVRRVRNLYYTHGFGQIVFQEMLMCKAKVSSLHVQREVN